MNAPVEMVGAEAINVPAAWNDIAVDLANRGFMASAAAAGRRALLNEDNPRKRAILLANYGNMLRRCGDRAGALVAFGEALGIDPGNHGARFNRAVWLLEEGESADALMVLDGLLREEAGNPDWRFARACVLLQAGRWAEGFEAYECRLESQRFGCPFWDGKPLKGGARLLLHAEQGLGDMIMYHRFRPLLDRVVPAERVDYVVHQVLATQLGAQRAGCIVQNNDWHLPMMSLPHVLGLDGVQGGAAYLNPLHSMGFLVPPGTRWKVGLVWRAKTTVKSMTVDERLHGQSKSMPLEVLLELTRIKGAALYGLQHNSTDVADIEAGHLVNNLGHVLHDFSDLASFVSQMDVVVSVDTAPAHLAGALGVPVIVCIRNHSAWHWQVGGRTAWYDSARVLAMPGGWDGGAIAAEVERCLSELPR